MNLSFFLFFAFVVILIILFRFQRKKYAFHRKRTDLLTNLPNRRSLEQFIEARTTPLNLPIAVVVIDLDNFNWINEKYGYESGDSVLVEFSERLAFSAPAHSLAARIEGNKFALAIPGTYSREEIQTMLADQFLSLQSPFYISGAPVHLTFSAGVALAPEDGRNGHTLLLHAERALRHVKHHGKNNLVLYNTSFQRQDLELQLAMSFRSALQNGEFFLCYQPKLSIHSGKADSVEALIRWNSPIHGTVSPALFIPVAEKNGFIFDLTKWILQEACRQIKKWSETNHTFQRVAVNISAPLFLSDRLPEMIHDILHDCKLDARFLELEITETAVMEDFQNACRIITLLKKEGITISLDDFGTGVSSLTHLKNLPIDTLKIDKSFINEIHTSFEDKALVEMIIQLANLFGLSVTAEGVEKQEQMNVLQRLGCDSIQGYLISRPELPDVLDAYFTEKKYGS
ncbi:bifunctional diguanylate cyclase/phosphodiesterase [Domibacillus sp. PGB-M46]|uniref:putative bifunctional diguanylate cyclase/phosphodiesterase n=1 Tax=Domibacillus sp. PGB-M46 TaxID=2910255 RepID=UPI001F55EC89|nr:bifunctional diguanylate cyclase/phosphodiesterase [Domibacillus sp. PGB-M46]MCI2254861.1 bifunctional diguanylate cyclase/phosphodiesterase [Domibacillus sp. PGB-M46]